ncbi:MAG: alpha/beta fold hydrolase [Alphaproteobacteria bacterium]|nr:alpha/beta fold hydrolase [Alphaproteobacteria bacterium]
MNYLKSMFMAGLVVAAGILPANGQQPATEKGAGLEPCFIKGVKSRVKCMTLDVPLDYADPAGPTISVFAAVLPATGSNVEPDPLWVFAGGPGQAAAELGAIARTAFKHIRRTRDIVLVDQRGTGKSNPLQCEIDPTVVMESLSDWTNVVAECRAGYDIDVRHFTMENVIRDMEAVRSMLGYEQLNLWGGSWGTRTVGLYLKRYPAHVRSIIVDGVAPPDLPLFETAPESAERALRLLVEDCEKSAACSETYSNLAEDVRAYLAKAEAGELRYEGADPLTGEDVSFSIPFNMAVESIRSVMYSADATVMLPYMIHQAAAGNLKPIVASLSSGSAAESMYVGATLSILCGEEIPRTRPDQLESAAKDSFAKDSYFETWKAGCDAWDALPPAADALEPATGDVPALILSGNLDPITPPSMGEHWLRGFPNGRHIIVHGNGHITSTTACMPRLLGKFVDTLDAQALDDSCLGHLKRLPVVTGLNGQVD